MKPFYVIASLDKLSMLQTMAEIYGYEWFTDDEGKIHKEQKTFFFDTDNPPTISATSATVAQAVEFFVNGTEPEPVPAAPQYRPYTAEEAKYRLLSRPLENSYSDFVHIVTGAGPDAVRIHDDWITFETILSEYTHWPNEDPCGMLVSGDENKEKK